MDSKKFLITDPDFITKKLENWKCDKCGSKDNPKIIEKQDDNGEMIEMYIKCNNCDRIITVSPFNF